MRNMKTALYSRRKSLLGKSYYYLNNKKKQKNHETYISF